jgi:predicted nuclease of restriction endonuclease-like (RecB) superfamily
VDWTGRSPVRRTNVCVEKGTAAISKVDRPPADYEIRDPFVLEFLNLKDEYSESDVEDALIAELERFLLELGNDFTCVARRRRLRIGTESARIEATHIETGSHPDRFR